jgi:hypothetical protein
MTDELSGQTTVFLATSLSDFQAFSPNGEEAFF